MNNNPLRNGHAGGHLREPFADLVESGQVPADSEHNRQPLSPRRLTDLLWNCTDVMPGALCRDLDLPTGSNYAQGARRYRTSMP